MNPWILQHMYHTVSSIPSTHSQPKCIQIQIFIVSNKNPHLVTILCPQPNWPLGILLDVFLTQPNASDAPWCPHLPQFQKTPPSSILTSNHQPSQNFISLVAIPPLPSTFPLLTPFCNRSCTPQASVWHAHYHDKYYLLSIHLQKLPDACKCHRRRC